MIYPLLCHFNNHYGPRIILKSPELSNSIHLNHIPLLMDLYKDGFFIHEYGTLRSINLIFEIESPLARGKAELLQISLICFDKQYDLSSFNELLDLFVIELQNISKAYKAFHSYSNDSAKIKEKYNEVASLFFLFNQSLPKNEEIIRKNTKKMLTYGLSHFGKSNIIKNFQESLNVYKSNTFNRSAFEDFNLF